MIALEEAEVAIRIQCQVHRTFAEFLFYDNSCCSGIIKQHHYTHHTFLRSTGTFRTMRRSVWEGALKEVRRTGLPFEVVSHASAGVGAFRTRGWSGFSKSPRRRWNSKLWNPGSSEFFFDHRIDYTGLHQRNVAESCLMLSECFRSFEICFRFMWGVSVMLFDCGRIFLLSSFTINCCFSEDTCCRCLPAFLFQYTA